MASIVQRLKFTSLVLGFVFSTLVTTLHLRADEIVLQQDGYTLTEHHVKQAIEIEAAFSDGGPLSDNDRLQIRADLVEEFELDPRETLETLTEVYADVVSGAAFSDDLVPEGKQLDTTISNAEHPAADFKGPGHAQMQEIFRNFVSNGWLQGGGHFSGSLADPLRAYVMNSVVSTSHSNAYSSGDHRYYFCAGGVFNYYYGSSTSVTGNAGGAEVSSTYEASARGVWDTYQQEGNAFIVMYSNDPAFAEDSMNNSGLLILPVAAYQEDLIQIGVKGTRATPDSLLARRPQICN